MYYISTRGEAGSLGFEDVLLNGLARDGGLYVPQDWPVFSAEEITGFAALSYTDLAVRVMAPYIGAALTHGELEDVVETAYASFDHRAVTPLRQLDAGLWLLELFHGPTLAFKDVAMQVLGPLFDHALKRRGKRVTIVGATSGDTGSAAIEAMRGRDAVDVFILHPHGRTSEIQRRQMTTVADPNVHNIAIEGTFDDCQALVKAMFADSGFRNRIHMAGVNSINWARVMAQVVYYFSAGVALGAPHRAVSFCVPTGNFGDVLAGYVAQRMGLPISRLVIATNVNDILVRALKTGRYETGAVTPTVSPSMDIQVSSNFERLLFDATGRDAGAVRAMMASLEQSGGFTLAHGALDSIRARFDTVRVSEEETFTMIRHVYEDTGLQIDPHSAVGVRAGSEAWRAHRDIPMVCLATAHPAKFAKVVTQATGTPVFLPPRLADLMELEEHYDVLPDDIMKVQAYIQARSRAAA